MSNLSYTKVIAALIVTAIPLKMAIANELSSTASDNPSGLQVGDLLPFVSPADTVFTPDDATHDVCEYFGYCPPAVQVTTQYVDFGVDFSVFSANPPIGVFNDPPEKWGGINDSENLDLITATCGRIVEPGTSTQATTDLIAIEAGYVGGPNDIMLTAYGLDGSVIGSSMADDGTGADGDLVAEVNLSGSSDIASFCVTTPTDDSYGMRRVHLNTPTTSPEPVVESVYIDSTSIADVNGNGYSEVAYLREDDDQPIVFIKDSRTGDLINQVEFLNDRWNSISVSADYDNAGNPLLSVMATTKAKKARIQVRNAMTGVVVKNIDLTQ